MKHYYSSAEQDANVTRRPNPIIKYFSSCWGLFDPIVEVTLHQLGTATVRLTARPLHVFVVVMLIAEVNALTRNSDLEEIVG